MAHFSYLRPDQSYRKFPVRRIVRRYTLIDAGHLERCLAGERLAWYELLPQLVEELECGHANTSRANNTSKTRRCGCCGPVAATTQSPEVSDAAGS